MAPALPTAHDPAMEVIRALGRPRPTPRALAIARLIGCLYVVAGLGIAWLTLTTPFVDVFAAHSQAFAGATAMHALGWLTALALPGLCLIVGAHRILDFADVSSPFTRRRDPLAGLGAGLGDDYTAICDLILAGGRHISWMIIGPQGIVVLGRLPNPSTSRQVDGHWETRLEADRWIAIEDPLDRTARDAEAVRRWLVGDEHGFVVKVYAVVVTDQAPANRNAAVAVVGRGGIPAFLASLPPHRTFTPARRTMLVDRIRSSLA
jgi:hypothetical protein